MTEPRGWRESTHTQRETACVEVGRVNDGAAVHGTKDRSAGYFTTTEQQWSAFIHVVKTDQFN